MPNIRIIGNFPEALRFALFFAIFSYLEKMAIFLLRKF